MWFNEFRRYIFSRISPQRHLIELDFKYVQIDCVKCRKNIERGSLADVYTRHIDDSKYYLFYKLKTRAWRLDHNVSQSQIAIVVRAHARFSIVQNGRQQSSVLRLVTSFARLLSTHTQHIYILFTVHYLQAAAGKHVFAPRVSEQIITCAAAVGVHRSALELIL